MPSRPSGADLARRNPRHPPRPARWRERQAAFDLNNLFIRPPGHEGGDFSVRMLAISLARGQVGRLNAIVAATSGWQTAREFRSGRRARGKTASASGSVSPRRLGEIVSPSVNT